MENFVVSARKYRPITFDAVVGQSSITNTLKNAIKNNHLAQAFLFTGPRGVGKTTCARIFAKTINCENLGENMEPCDQCESCTSFNQNNSFNIHELDAASNNSVEDIRRLVEQVRIPPQVGKYKVYIIDEVHMLSQAAFNAFLKTLEEPPPYAKFILATTEKHKIIPTILSRCQIYDFNRITVKDTVEYLEYVAKNENVEAEQEALHVIAQKADGAMRDALSIFDQIVSFSGNTITYKSTIDNLNVLDVEYYFQLVDLFLAGDISSSLLIFDEIIGNGFDGHHFINGLASHLRNLLVGKDPQTIALLETSDSIKSQYLDQCARVDIRFLIKALDICSTVDLNYKTSSNKRLLVELNLMKLCKLNHPLPTITAPTENAPTVKAVSPKPKAVSSAATPSSKPKVETTTKVQEPAPTLQTNEVKKEPVVAEKKETPQVTEPEVSKKEAPKTTRRRKTVSIIDSLNKAPKEKAEEIDLEGEMNREFSEVKEKIKIEDLHKSLEKYYQTIKKDKPSFAANLKPEHIQIAENNKIIISLNNKALDDRDLKYDLLQFLKADLNNNEISLTTTIKEAKTVAKKGPMDSYKEMVAANPKMEEFRKQLDLDF
ncbi:MAG: DNA polymerase III subunit gamma/tau [Bacteroidetes bacterium]|nr:MAG: DNA polymerase III subunit gamma/tau [Bacteroidota bacterium]